MYYSVEMTYVFKRELKKLARKYPKCIDEVDFLVSKLLDGFLVGEDLEGINLPNNKVFKTRIPNKDARKGMRGGFRVIYYLVTEQNEIHLLTLYSKSNQETVSNKRIVQIINHHLEGQSDSP